MAQRTIQSPPVNNWQLTSSRRPPQPTSASISVVNNPPSNQLPYYTGPGAGIYLIDPGASASPQAPYGLLLQENQTGATAAKIGILNKANSGAAAGGIDIFDAGTNGVNIHATNSGGGIGIQSAGTGGIALSTSSTGGISLTTSNASITATSATSYSLSTFTGFSISNPSHIPLAFNPVSPPNATVGAYVTNVINAAGGLQVGVSTATGGGGNILGALWLRNALNGDIFITGESAGSGGGGVFINPYPTSTWNANFLAGGNTGIQLLNTLGLAGSIPDCGNPQAGDDNPNAAIGLLNQATTGFSLIPSSTTQEVYGIAMINQAPIVSYNFGSSSLPAGAFGVGIINNGTQTNSGFGPTMGIYIRNDGGNTGGIGIGIHDYPSSGFGQIEIYSIPQAASQHGSILMTASHTSGGGNGLIELDSDQVNILARVQGSFGLAASLLGFYGASPVAQAAHPTTLAQVITALANLGLTA